MFTLNCTYVQILKAASENIHCNYYFLWAEREKPLLYDSVVVVVVVVVVVFVFVCVFVVVVVVVVVVACFFFFLFSSAAAHWGTLWGLWGHAFSPKDWMTLRACFSPKV